MLRATILLACACANRVLRDATRDGDDRVRIAVRVGTTDLELHASSDESPLATARRFCETSALAELRAALGKAVRSADCVAVVETAIRREQERHSARAVSWADFRLSGREVGTVSYRDRDAVTEASSELRVIIVATAVTSGLERLLRSLSYFRHGPIDVLGLGARFEGTIQKLAWVHDHLGQLARSNHARRSELVLVVDAYDVVLQGDAAQISRAFSGVTHGDPNVVLFGAERACVANVCGGTVGDAQARRPHLNAGAYLGRLGNVLDMLDGVSPRSWSPISSDQLLLSTVFANRSIGPRPRLDDDARLLLNLADFATSADSNLPSSSVDGACSAACGSIETAAMPPRSCVIHGGEQLKPCVVHGNGVGGKSLLAKLTAKLDWLAEPTAATSRDMAELRRIASANAFHARQDAPGFDPGVEHRGGSPG